MERCNMQSEKPMMQKAQLSHEIEDDKFEHSKNLREGILKTIDELIKPEINRNANEPFEQRRFKKKKRLGQRF
jgi:hypothetical protein